LTEDRRDWREANRARWDELVAIHLAPGGYDLHALRSGQGRLHPIEETELGDVRGLRLLHLQCHFGKDTLTLAQRGAEVVGLDFSSAAIAAARALADELGLAAQARFVEADLYNAPAAIAEPHAFDCVFVTWGAINWLPDIARWAQIVAQFLRPGGFLYLADQHPAAFVFDDSVRTPDGLPGLLVPYFSTGPLVFENVPDYANQDATLGTEHVFSHPLGHSQNRE
jgi:SAM-dependent methyltransferase